MTEQPEMIYVGKTYHKDGSVVAWFGKRASADREADLSISLPQHEGMCSQLIRYFLPDDASLTEAIERLGLMPFFDNELHRDDGPAVVMASGAQEWWLNGVRQLHDHE